MGSVSDGLDIVKQRLQPVPVIDGIVTTEQIEIVLFTVWTALLSSVMILPVGVALAWLLARKNWRGKAIVETVVSLPLVMPPVATGLILLKIFGRNSPLGGFLENELGIGIVFTWKGVVLAMAVMSFPLLVRSVRVAIESINPRYEQVAATLGKRTLPIIWTVTLPMAWRGIVGGFVLAFARALGEFGATILIAGNIPGRTTTVSVAIYSAIQIGDDRTAFTLLVFAVVIAFVALYLSEQKLEKHVSV